MIDLNRITACGECCDSCVKRTHGQCRGCVDTDGKCEEWAASGQCVIHACVHAHGVAFCGLCPEFPCDHLPMLKWRPDCIPELPTLAQIYRKKT